MYCESTLCYIVTIMQSGLLKTIYYLLKRYLITLLQFRINKNRIIRGRVVDESELKN